MRINLPLNSALAPKSALVALSALALLPDSAPPAAFRDR